MPTTMKNRLTPDRCHRRVANLNRELSDRSPTERSILSPPTIATPLKWSVLMTANHLSSFLQCTIAVVCGPRVKHALGWSQYQVRRDWAMRRHWQLVYCAFSFF